MPRLLAVLVSVIALGAEGPSTALGAGHAQPNPSSQDVIAALERIRDTGVFPEYLSLEYVELHRAVAEIAERDPHGYAARLASRVLTRVVVNLRRPLLSAGEQPYLEGDLLGPPGLPPARVELQGSIDAGPWRTLTELGNGPLGPIICDSLGPVACAAGWHSLAIRAIVKGPGGPGGEPSWIETREMPALVYGIFRTSEVERPSASPGEVPTPATWIRGVLAAPASLFDVQLPSVPLPAWLASTLHDAGQPQLGEGLRWASRHCGVDMVERFADRSRAPACVAFSAKNATWAVELEFLVGPLGATTVTSWPEIPTFHQGWVEHEGRRSLEISSLSELAAAFTRPPGTWPAPDLRVRSTDIVYWPPVPDAGEEISVEFTLHNDGRQGARARIEFWFDGAGIEQAERIDFVADVPAGRFYRFRRSTRMPHGPGTGFAGLSAQLAPPRGSMKPAEEQNATNNDAVQLLGAQPTARIPD
jgi:hypothetical protein